MLFKKSIKKVAQEAGTAAYETVKENISEDVNKSVVDLLPAIISTGLVLISIFSSMRTSKPKPDYSKIVIINNYYGTKKVR